MVQEGLHHLEAEEWKVLERQFAQLYRPTMSFVLDNKGSLSEASETYVEAFIYYIQLLELKGFNLHLKAESLIYSFARRLWIHKLEKRRVELDFVRHRREFFEMEDAFHLIASINEKSQRTAQKLAEIGEPCRTLLLEHVGRRQALDDICRRLGYTSEDRALGALAQCFRKLMKQLEAKEFNIEPKRFIELLRYAMDGMEAVQIQNDEEKVALAMVSRAISLIRNHTIRTDRTERFKAMEVKMLPSAAGLLDEEQPEDNPKTSIMKSISLLAATAMAAVAVAALTAFGVAEHMLNKEVQTEEALTAVAEEINVAVEAPVWIAPKDINAFAVAQGGYALAPAWPFAGAGIVHLHNKAWDQPRTARILVLDTLANLALLKIDDTMGTPSRLPYRFAAVEPSIGEALYSLSHTEGQLEFTDGSFNAAFNRGTTRLRLAAQAGAPLIESKGQVVGMVMEQKEGKAMVVGADVIRSWLLAQKDHYPDLEPSQKNGFFYLDKPQQVEQLQMFIYQVELIP